MVELDIRPVGAALGAEIHGIDLNTLTDDEMEAIHQAFADHLVLFFPKQDLTPDGHRRFAQRFGELEVVPSLTKLDEDHPEIVVLNDLDTPAAVAALDVAVAAGRGVSEAAALLGVRI